MSVSNLADKAAQQLDIKANAVEADSITAISDITLAAGTLSVLDVVATGTIEAPLGGFDAIELQPVGTHTLAFAALGTPVAITRRKGTVTITATAGVFATGTTATLQLTGAAAVIGPLDVCLASQGPSPTNSAHQSHELGICIQAIASGAVDIDITNFSAGNYSGTDIVISYLLM